MQNKSVLEIDEFGSKRWYLNGVYHRTDGPAIEYVDGNKFWYLNDKLHRTDGPAIERPSGDKEWYSNGKRHRTDGPAVERSNGDKSWWLDGDYLAFDKWLELTPLSVQEKIKLRFKYAEE